MIIIIKRNEVNAVASYVDFIINAVNQIGMSVDNKFPVAPQNALEKAEEFINSKFSVEKKVVSIKIIPVLNNIVITVRDEFVIEFFTLVQEVYAPVIPAAIVTVKAVIELQKVFNENSVPKIEAFESKWFND